MEQGSEHASPRVAFAGHEAEWWTLTPHQRRVGELKNLGFLEKQIAADLGISVRQVKRHIGNAASRVSGEGKPDAKLRAAYAAACGATTDGKDLIRWPSS